MAMKKPTRVKQKTTGRARTDSAPLMGFRADPVIRASIIRWAEKQPDTPTLSEAIRRLVELGLTIRTKIKQPPAARADRAKELATKTIEKIMDPSASPEVRAERRRRLVKGPSEFREHRTDLPRASRK
jgi:hypothetical protein